MGWWAVNKSHSCSEQDAIGILCSRQVNQRAEATAAMWCWTPNIQRVPGSKGHMRGLCLQPLVCNLGVHQVCLSGSKVARPRCSEPSLWPLVGCPEESSPLGNLSSGQLPFCFPNRYHQHQPEMTSCVVLFNGHSGWMKTLWAASDRS